jgi:hypothetical protein
MRGKPYGKTARWATVQVNGLLKGTANQPLTGDAVQASTPKRGHPFSSALIRHQTNRAGFMTDQQVLGHCSPSTALFPSTVSYKLGHTFSGSIDALQPR